MQQTLQQGWDSATHLFSPTVLFYQGKQSRANMLRMSSYCDCQHALDDTDHQMSPRGAAKPMVAVWWTDHVGKPAIFRQTTLLCASTEATASFSKSTFPERVTCNALTRQRLHTCGWETQLFCCTDLKGTSNVNSLYCSLLFVLYWPFWCFCRLTRTKSYRDLECENNWEYTA